MVNYANGKIYMICLNVEHEEGEVYIGSRPNITSVTAYITIGIHMRSIKWDLAVEGFHYMTYLINMVQIIARYLYWRV